MRTFFSILFALMVYTRMSTDGIIFSWFWLIVIFTIWFIIKLIATFADGDTLAEKIGSKVYMAKNRRALRKAEKAKKKIVKEAEKA